MLFKSQVYTQASGSVGGLTYSHNSYGMYTRARAIPVNPSTIYQTTVRQMMADLTQYWSSTLTAAQRSAWNAYAANVSVKNRVGDDVYLSGLNHFVRSNIPRLQAGLAQVDDGPTVFTLPESDTSAAVTASEATQNYSVTFDTGRDWVSEDDAGLLLLGSLPQNVTINFYKGPYRFADSIDGDSVTPPTSPATIASPHAFVQGQRLFTSLRISRADGRLSDPFRRQCDAGA